MQPRLKPRFFSVQEANDIVPFLESIFEKIREVSEKQRVLSRDLRDLVNMWGDSIFSEKNADNAYYKELLEKRDAVTEIISESLAEVHARGCIVKDAVKGLVDFYHMKDGKTVFLCWRYGEKHVHYWHHVNSGFISRRRVSQ